MDLLTKFHENNLGRRRFRGEENKIWRFQDRTMGRKPGEVGENDDDPGAFRAYLDVELALPESLLELNCSCSML